MLQRDPIIFSNYCPLKRVLDLENKGITAAWLYWTAKRRKSHGGPEECVISSKLNLSLREFVSVKRMSLSNFPKEN